MEVGIDRIVSASSAYFNVPEELILEPSIRTARVVEARHFAHYLASVVTCRSHEFIAKHFNADRSTVCRAVKKIEDLKEDSEEARKHIRKLTSELER